jgi:hypothetical protein
MSLHPIRFDTANSYRTVHARNLIRRECRMLNCWNCRNDYLRTQRIGSSRRSRPVRMSMGSIMETTGHRREEYHGKTGHRRAERTEAYGNADEEGRRDSQQPDRHITTNYAQQASIVCIHNARQHNTSLLRGWMA